LVFSCSILTAQVDLGSSASFGVLGASTVTNTGNTVITGDLGVNPGTAITGFGPGTRTGGTYTGTDSLALSAHQDASTAYDYLRWARAICFPDRKHLGHGDWVKYGIDQWR
jgi:hypothetical protein